METLTIDEMVLKFPTRWVLVGNPEIENPEINGSINSKLLTGFALFSSTNKLDLVDAAKELEAQVKTTVCFYIGKIDSKFQYITI